MTSNHMKTLEYRLGVDVGGTNLVAAVVDGSFRILSKVSIPAGAHRGIDEIMRSISDTVEVREVIKPVYNFKAGKER